MIATGDRCAVIAASPTAEETEKRLIGPVLEGSDHRPRQLPRHSAGRLPLPDYRKAVGVCTWVGKKRLASCPEYVHLLCEWQQHRCC
jgi:hypothetical protein